MGLRRVSDPVDPLDPPDLAIRQRRYSHVPLSPLTRARARKKEKRQGHN